MASNTDQTPYLSPNLGNDKIAPPGVYRLANETTVSPILVSPILATPILVSPIPVSQILASPTTESLASPTTESLASPTTESLASPTTESLASPTTESPTTESQARIQDEPQTETTNNQTEISLPKRRKAEISILALPGCILITAIALHLCLFCGLVFGTAYLGFADLIAKMFPGRPLMAIFIYIRPVITSIAILSISFIEIIIIALDFAAQAESNKMTGVRVICIFCFVIKLILIAASPITAATLVGMYGVHIKILILEYFLTSGFIVIDMVLSLLLFLNSMLILTKRMGILINYKNKTDE